MEFVSWMLVSVVTAVSALYLWNTYYSQRLYRFPPGPKGLPVLGCFWYIFRDMHVLFTELAETWGDCFSVNILGQRMVVINTPEAVRETYGSGDVFSGRPPFPTFNKYFSDCIGFTGPNKMWSKQRKLIHKILNMHGTGMETAENVIHEELSHVTEWLEKNKGTTVNLDDVIYPSVTNIIVIMLQGKRYEYGSKVLKNIEVLDDSSTRGFSTVNRIVFPFLQHVNLGPGKDAILNQQASEQYLKDIYEESKATYDPNVTRGMIDYLLRYQEETRQEDGVTWLEERLIKAMVMEMVAAGSISTRMALCAFFLIMLHNTDVAKRIQDEIDTVIGSHRLVKIQDRSNMPYTTAAILELLRYISHTPLGLPHVTTDDVALGDYFLPKGTTLLANTWRFHHDSNLWPEPWEFKPERFLDENQKLLPPEHLNLKNLQPFGIGRRSCVGETFARSRIFLFITTLLQRFDFQTDPARPPPPCDPRTYDASLALCPKPYYVRLKLRD